MENFPSIIIIEISRYHRACVLCNEDIYEGEAYGWVKSNRPGTTSGAYCLHCTEAANAETLRYCEDVDRMLLNARGRNFTVRERLKYQERK